MQGTFSLKMSKEDKEEIAAIVADRMAPMLAGLASNQAVELDQYYTSSEVAEKLKVKENTLYKWGREGRFPRGVNLAGDMRRYPASEILAWIAAQGATP